MKMDENAKQVGERGGGAGRWTPAGDPGTWEDIVKLVDGVAAGWEARKAEFLDGLYDDFRRASGAGFQSAADAGLELTYQVAMTEWFLFDRTLPSGQTPVGAAGERSPLLRQVAETQVFSRWQIEDRDPERGTMVVSNARPGADPTPFEVFAPEAAAHPGWDDGVVAMRIAEAGGDHIMVGKVQLYDRCPMSRQRELGLPASLLPGEDAAPGAPLVADDRFLPSLVGDIVRRASGMGAREVPAVPLLDAPEEGLEQAAEALRSAPAADRSGGREQGKGGRDGRR